VWPGPAARRHLGGQLARGCEHQDLGCLGRAGFPFSGRRRRCRRPASCPTRSAPCHTHPDRRGRRGWWPTGWERLGDRLAVEGGHDVGGYAERGEGRLQGGMGALSCDRGRTRECARGRPAAKSAHQDPPRLVPRADTTGMVSRSGMAATPQPPQNHPTTSPPPRPRSPQQRGQSSPSAVNRRLMKSSTASVPGPIRSMPSIPAGYRPGSDRGCSASARRAGGAGGRHPA